MPLTLKPRESSMKVGLDRLWIGKVVCDNDYPAGGYSLAGLAPNSKVKAMLHVSTEEAFQWHFDYDAQTLVAKAGATGIELSDQASSLDAVEVEICALID